MINPLRKENKDNFTLQCVAVHHVRQSRVEVIYSRGKGMIPHRNNTYKLHFFTLITVNFSSVAQRTELLPKHLFCFLMLSSFAHLF